MCNRNHFSQYSRPTAFHFSAFPFEHVICVADYCSDEEIGRPRWKLKVGRIPGGGGKIKSYRLSRKKKKNHHYFWFLFASIRCILTNIFFILYLLNIQTDIWSNKSINNPRQYSINKMTQFWVSWVIIFLPTGCVKGSEWINRNKNQDDQSLYFTGAWRTLSEWCWRGVMSPGQRLPSAWRWTAFAFDWFSSLLTL